ncbi:hypothetical protein OH76DRAFT_360839 [Lentinus brumalis]|uniref:Uncharacterized protein n=1 Tax=Lentinus brumalis TaxID=2498619 RepID=A0A371CJ88_9APHY|nr:hypothetical protein OH76DRAFT_360839 [Polyporus brumalis]
MSPADGNPSPAGHLSQLTLVSEDSSGDTATHLLPDSGCIFQSQPASSATAFTNHGLARTVAAAYHPPLRRLGPPRVYDRPHQLVPRGGSPQFTRSSTRAPPHRPPGRTAAACMAQHCEPQAEEAIAFVPRVLFRSRIDRVTHNSPQALSSVCSSCSMSPGPPGSS